MKYTNWCKELMEVNRLM